MSVVTADLLREKIAKIKVTIKVRPVNAGAFVMWKMAHTMSAMSDEQLLEEYARFKVEEEGK